MFFLVYPPEPAPLIGKKIDPSEEIFPLLEPNGLVIGRAPRSLCHAGSMLLHPVVNMHIIDRNARLYLQKRSKRKRTYPGCWDTSVGGHVGYGEQLEEALYVKQSKNWVSTTSTPSSWKVSYMKIKEKRACGFICHYLLQKPDSIWNRGERSALVDL